MNLLCGQISYVLPTLQGRARRPELCSSPLCDQNGEAYV